MQRFIKLYKVKSAIYIILTLQHFNYNKPLLNTSNYLHLSVQLQISDDICIYYLQLIVKADSMNVILKSNASMMGAKQRLSQLIKYNLQAKLTN